MIDQAMILAAGLGTRMKDLVNDIPKPMVVVDGSSLIEKHLNYLLKHNIKKVVINTHYKADIFESFIKSLSINSEIEIIFSREEVLLGTGGGVKNALKFLSKEPFFILNSDAIFQDDIIPATIQLERAWDPEIMPMILLLAKKENSFGYWRDGDFDINAQGRLNQDNQVRAFINSGMYLTDYKLFSKYADNILQFYPQIFQDLMSTQSLYGCVYNGIWFHIGDLKAYQDYINKSHCLL